jgi:hypothetical protein
MLTRIIRYAVIAVSWWMVIVHAALAQPNPYPTPTVPPVIGPITTPTVPPIIGPTPTLPALPDLRPSAMFTFADATQVKTRSTTGHFRFVGLHLNETVDITLQLPGGLLSPSVRAQALDGGAILSFSVKDAGAVASIRFYSGNRPGLYRVLVPGLARSVLFHFWVADPSNPNPAMTPILLNPTH